MSFITDKYGIYSSGLLGRKGDPPSNSPPSDFRARFTEASQSLAIASDDATTVSIANSKDDSAQDSSGVPGLLGAAQSVVGVASNALESIAALQKQQLDNAETAADSPLSSTTSSMQTQNATIDSEITRIQAAATYNGKNVFSQLNALNGPVLEEGQGAIAVNIPNISNLQLTSTVTITNQTTAASAVIALTNASQSSGQLLSAIDSAGGKVDATIATSQAAPSVTPEQSDQETVSDLAGKIANQLGSPYQNEYAKRSIIEASTKQPDEKDQEFVA
jgi:hypothetical protein